LTARPIFFEAKDTTQAVLRCQRAPLALYERLQAKCGAFPTTAHLQANQNRVDTADLKNRLCDVQTDRRNCFAYFTPPNCGSLNSAQFHWHLRAGGKANHTIKSGHSTAHWHVR
jgi:hypothetical protein